MRTTLACVALAVAYLVLTRASAIWLAQALTTPGARGNLIVLGLLVAVAVRQKPEVTVRAALLPVGVVASAAVAFVAARWFFPWNRLHAVIALVGVYGLAGCFVAPVTWRRGLAVLAFVVAALPFGEQLDVLVGYPLRLAITDAARSILGHLGADGMTRATLLVFESGAAQIDVPCSGVKSLWAGALLALAAPLVLNKRFGVRWVLASLAFALALCIGNTLRIVVLVLVAVPAKLPHVAELVHRPLGCAAFIVAALAYIHALRRSSEARATSNASTHIPAWLTAAVAGCIALVTPLAPASATTHTLDERDFIALPFPSDRVDLTSTERAFFTQQGAERVTKARFAWNGAHGSIILVRSAHAAAQHPPEQCLTSAGHVIRDARTVLLDTTLTIRTLDLAHGSAVGWFQSGFATHGDYAARVWASGTWVQVSILFDEIDAAHVPADLVHVIYRAIVSSYQGENNASQ